MLWSPTALFPECFNQFVRWLEAKAKKPPIGLGVNKQLIHCLPLYFEAQAGLKRHGVVAVSVLVPFRIMYSTRLHGSLVRGYFISMWGANVLGRCFLGRQGMKLLELEQLQT